MRVKILIGEVNEDHEGEKNRTITAPPQIPTQKV